MGIARVILLWLLTNSWIVSWTAAESVNEVDRDRKVQMEQSRQSGSQLSVSDSLGATPQTPDQGADHWSVMASGGGWSNLGDFRLGATLGQTVTGRVSLGSTHLMAGFWQNFESGPCCVGRVGDANGLGEYPDEISLGDIMLMVDAKFISLSCSRLLCLTEADVNQDGGINPNCDDHISLVDIMVLVDFLFITGPENATLPDCL